MRHVEDFAKYIRGRWRCSFFHVATDSRGSQAFRFGRARQNPFEDDLRIRPQLRIHIERAILQLNAHVP